MLQWFGIEKMKVNVIVILCKFWKQILPALFSIRVGLVMQRTDGRRMLTWRIEMDSKNGIRKEYSHIISPNPFNNFYEIVYFASWMWFLKKDKWRIMSQMSFTPHLWDHVFQFKPIRAVRSMGSSLYVLTVINIWNFFPLIISPKS